ncbi:MAG: ABC transporter permease [Candidatus Dormibacteraeota bacterium]|jgi:simple sugar transport system permease protein|nr:ABC transporter permease [Candidatus Dormibacteraeota bacterium]MDQ6790007.1 ABC transporter permease [Candidatus Dormibacteraeota bacterium]
MGQTVDAGVATAPAPAPPRVTQRSLGRRLMMRPEIGSLVGVILIYIFFFVVASPFRSTASLATILYASSTIGMMAVPVALLMIGGEFDLSAGVAVTTSALVAALFSYNLNLNIWIGVLVALVVAVGIGFINGYLVVRTRIPSFLVTLGTFLMLQGLNLAVTKGVTGAVASQDVSQMTGFSSAATIFASSVPIGPVSVRITVFWWILFIAISTVLLLKTRVGNWVFSVGGDANSARAVGVPVNKTKIGLFMVVGLMAWFVGMHILFSFNTVQSGQGVGNEFLYIIAAVIGGCLLTGGFGSTIGSAMGALIFGMTTEGIIYAGWNPDWFKFFLGIMLLLATVLNAYVRQLASRR